MGPRGVRPGLSGSGHVGERRGDHVGEREHGAERPKGREHRAQSELPDQPRDHAPCPHAIPPAPQK